MTEIVGSFELIANREPWMEQALCPEVDDEIFFIDKGGSPGPAKKVCAACPVAGECLDFAMRNHEPFGIWGGLTAFERKNLRRGEASRHADCGTWAGATRHHRLHERLCFDCRKAVRGHSA